MDNQPVVNEPVNQPVYEPVNQPILQVIDQGSSHNMWYITGAVVVIAGLALWYYFTPSPIIVDDTPPTITVGAETSVVDVTQAVPLVSGNSVANILTDLSQTSDGSAALNQAAASSAEAVQGF